MKVHIPPDPTVDRRVETLVRSRRLRAHRHQSVGGRVVFDPDAQPLFEISPSSGEREQATLPEPFPHHDVLFVPPREVLEHEEFFRFPVTKTGVQSGTFNDAPELMDVYDYAQRMVQAIARPQDWGKKPGQGPSRGPAFCTLPVKPEPAATSCGVCYLINAENLNFINAWTAEEWNDTPGGTALRAAPGVDESEFEALLAGPRGKVFRVKLSGIDVWNPGESAVVQLSLPSDDPRQESGGARCEIDCLDLGDQVEVWQQLRNGCAMGRVSYRDVDGERLVPLVNITTLTPLPPKASKSDIQALGKKARAASDELIATNGDGS